MRCKPDITGKDPITLNVPATDPPNASEALRHQRAGVRRVGLRYVAQQSRALADQDPTHFNYISHGTLSRIERSQGAWFRSSVDMGMVEALIQILWSGDHTAFARDTGLQLLFAPHQDKTEQRQPLVRLPHYLESEHPSLYQRRRRLHEAPDHHADFLYQHQSSDMEPFIAARQLLTCQTATSVPAGHLAVLQRTTGLTLAWSAGNNTYLTQQDPHPFQLNANESVYGVVVALQPSRPDLAHAGREEPEGREVNQTPAQQLTTLLVRHAPKEREPRKPLTVSCPIALQDELRDEAHRLRIPLQAYLETALEGLLDHFEPNPGQLPDPMPRPNTDDPNFTARVPTRLLARLGELVAHTRQLEGRTDSPTKAAIVLFAYRQLLTATQDASSTHAANR